MPRGCATAHKGGSADRWFYAPRMGAAFALPNITPRAPRPCSPTFRVCAWSFHLRPSALTACRSPPSATPIRWCSWSQHASTAARGEVEDNGEAMPLDVAFVLKEGRDVTLISWGAMVKETLAAAETLDAEGISAEVIDLATLKPYDEETLLSSVAKTGRCIIVHEAARTGGFGAEIAALIAERGLTSLLAPVARVTGYD